MGKFMCEIDGIKVFEDESDKWKGRENVNSLMSEGVAYRFYKFLSERGLIDEYESVDDVYANMSGARDGYRFDIHDNYRFTLDDEYKNLEISFLYVANGNLWGVILDKPNDKWFGEFEIPVI